MCLAVLEEWLTGLPCGFWRRRHVSDGACGQMQSGIEAASRAGSRPLLQGDAARNVCTQVGSASDRHVDFVSLALLAAHHRGGFFVTDDLLGLRIPLDGPTEPDGDVCQVAGRHGAVV